MKKKEGLFKLDEKYVLAYCISLDCKLDMGIALEFDKRFKGMKKWLLSLVVANEYNYPITIPTYKDKELKVFNLITKEKYWHKPTYQTIRICIKQMAGYCKRHNVKHLGMPKIGCGLDKLQWGEVKKIMEEEFKDIDINIEIRYL